MVEVRLTLKDIMNYIKALQEYFSLKDKVLVTNISAGTTKLTIPNGALYEGFCFMLGGVAVYAHRYGDAMYGGGGNTGNSSQVSRMIRCTDIVENGNDLVVNSFQANYIEHISKSSHGTITNVAVNQIIGIDPIIPDALKSLGGGITLTGGGLCAISKGIRKEYAYAVEELEIHKAKQGVEAAWKHYRNAVLFTWQLHRACSICLLWWRSGRAKHSSINYTVKWRNDAFGRLVQQCDICPDVENVCKGIDAAAGIHGRTPDLRSVRNWGWSYA